MIFHQMMKSSYHLCINQLHLLINQKAKKRLQMINQIINSIFYFSVLRRALHLHLIREFQFSYLFRKKVLKISKILKLPHHQNRVATNSKNLHHLHQHFKIFHSKLTNQTSFLRRWSDQNSLFLKNRRTQQFWIKSKMRKKKFIISFSTHISMSVSIIFLMITVTKFIKFLKKKAFRSALNFIETIYLPNLSIIIIWEIMLMLMNSNKSCELR